MQAAVKECGLRQSEEMGPTEGPTGAPAYIELCLVGQEQQEARLEQVRDRSCVIQA